MENLSYHRAESFIAQNNKDRVRVHDFVIFCQQTNHHSDLGPQPVSNMCQSVDHTLIQ